MKDRENVLRQLDEADNMLMIIQQSIDRGLKIDPTEAQRRFSTIRRKLKFISDRVTAS